MTSCHGILDTLDFLKIHDIDEFIGGYKTQLRLYQRLVFMKLVMQDSTIQEAAESVGVKKRTGYN